ncbi:T6SS effector amidase Tae4 family protein [Flavobacterium sp.]|uniref:T6SS effector amidase Tae4 family protein n=1 Tax=Flavobacterium sp. TaxID=239 RepID=UPI0040488716
MNNNDPGDDDYWLNTCATRLSKALNDAGFNISSDSDGAWEGANNKYYIVSTQKLFNYLSNNFNLAGEYPKGTTFLNGITAHSKYGKGIQHVDIFYKGETKNSNFHFWEKHWIFYQ